MPYGKLKFPPGKPKFSNEPLTFRYVQNRKGAWIFDPFANSSNVARAPVGGDCMYQMAGDAKQRSLVLPARAHSTQIVQGTEYNPFLLL